MTTGVWLVGARGNVASISMAGARAIASGVVDSTGMVTAREPMTSLDLPAVDDLVFGGHDIREQSIEQTVEKANEAGNVPDKETLDAVREDLREIDERVTIGTARQCGQVVEDLSDNEVGDKGTVADIVSQIQSDYEAFAEEQDVDRLVVVNAASTEPPIKEAEKFDTLDKLETAIENDDPDLPASALYAYAAGRRAPVRQLHTEYRVVSRRITGISLTE